MWFFWICLLVLSVLTVALTRRIIKNLMIWRIAPGTPVRMQPSEDSTVYYVCESEDLIKVDRPRNMVPGWVKLAKGGYVQLRYMTPPPAIKENLAKNGIVTG